MYLKCVTHITWLIDGCMMMNQQITFLVWHFSSLPGWITTAIESAVHSQSYGMLYWWLVIRFLGGQLFLTLTFRDGSGFKIIQIVIIRNTNCLGCTGILTGSQMSRMNNQVKQLITVETSLFRPISCLQQCIRMYACMYECMCIVNVINYLQLYTCWVWCCCNKGISLWRGLIFTLDCPTAVARETAECPPGGGWTICKFFELPAHPSSVYPPHSASGGYWRRRCWWRSDRVPAMGIETFSPRPVVASASFTGLAEGTPVTPTLAKQ